MPDPSPHNRAPSLQPCAPSLQPCAPSLQPARVSCVAQGFFGPRTPVDNLFAGPIAVSYFVTRDLERCVVVSPDAGGVARAKMFKEGLEAQGIVCGLAMIIKQARARAWARAWACASASACACACASASAS